MPLNWTFGRKLGLGFAVAAIAVLLVAIAGYQSTHHLIENDKLVDHTHQVRRGLSELLSECKDAETGQRGFVITGLDAFLEPYRSALVEIDRSFDNVRKLTSDNPNQQRRLDALRPLIDTKLAEMKSVIDERTNLGLDAARKIVAAGEG